jgi:hypothetical protein
MKGISEGRENLRKSDAAFRPIIATKPAFLQTKVSENSRTKRVDATFLDAFPAEPGRSELRSPGASDGAFCAFFWRFSLREHRRE